MDYNDQLIEECIDCLTRSAHQSGVAHNAVMEARYRLEGKVWPGAPLAYQASSSWRAIEIIRELQAEVADLKAKK